MKYRRIWHPTRSIWYMSWLAPENCCHYGLEKYIRKIMDEPGKLVMMGNKSGSQQVSDTPENLKKIKSPFTEHFEVLENVPQKKMHYQLEKLMIHTDPRVVATELPLRTRTAEGLIDVVLDTPDKIYILDYKPDAAKTQAFGQVNAYADMLSKLSGEPLEDFIVGWFDEEWYFECPLE